MGAGLLAACGVKPSSPKPVSKIRLGFIVPAQFNSWIIQMQREADSYAKIHADEIEYIKTQADGDITKQVFQIDDLLVKGIDVLVTMPLSPTALAEPLKRTMEEIPVVTFAWDLDTQTTVHFKCDERRFGRLGAEWLNEQLGSKGKVVILRGTAGTSADTDRYEAVIETLSPDIEILDEVFTEWDYAKGKKAMTALLAAHPVIDGVWSSGAAVSQGAVEAMQAAGRDLIPITAENNNGFLKMWKTLGLTSCGVVEPTHMVQDAFDAAIKLVRGEKVDPVCNVDMPLITDEKLDEIVRMDCSDDLWVPTKLTEEEIQEFYGLEKSS